jgi:hypothetical protein
VKLVLAPPQPSGWVRSLGREHTRGEGGEVKRGIDGARKTRGLSGRCVNIRIGAGGGRAGTGIRRGVGRRKKKPPAELRLDMREDWKD